MSSKADLKKKGLRLGLAGPLVGADLFKSRPEKEGIKTVDGYLRRHCQQFKSRPEKEGIKTSPPVAIPTLGGIPFKSRPEKEGIKTPVGLMGVLIYTSP